MKNTYKLLLIILLICAFNLNAQTNGNTIANDTISPLPYDFNANQNNALFLNSTESEVIYDAETGKYIFVEKIGDYIVKRPIYMTAEEYKEYKLNRDMLDYYKSKVSAKDGKKNGSEDAQKDLLPKYYVNSKFFESLFGSNEIEVNAQGSVVVSFGVLFQKTENPRISERNRKSTTFDFDQQISASINAKVGTRLNVNINYDTQSTFDFQNLVKLEYTPTEDDIIQKIEVGNVSMPLQSSLINGAQNLFGFKTKLQFGATEITSVFAKQQSQTRSVSAQGGATIQEFELKASDYDKNRHFFLAQKFRDNYDTALEKFPLINSSVNITRVEVWITNRSNQTENVRNIVAIGDLAEGLSPNNNNDNIGNTEVNINIGEHNPSNEVNNLFDLLSNTDIRSISSVNTAFNSIATNAFAQGTDYSVLENAQQLIVGRDFTVNPTLGYISLNRVLAESEVLAVAFEYTEALPSGEIKTYQVGELSGNGINAPDNLIVKLLRPEIINTVLPIWDLQMKNVYDLRSFQMNPDGFRLEILYEDPTTGVPLNILQNANTTNVITEASAQARDAGIIPLINMMRIDRLGQTNNSEPNGDGFFDYVEGITVNSQQGLVYFPVVEPFGSHIDGVENNGLLTNTEDEPFIFRELYDRTQPDVQNNFQNKDRYLITGYYKSEGRNGIPLGAFNVPRGSVNVTTGGRVLVEGVDYVVDYQIGNVQIINPSLIASNAPIQVSVETNNAFSTQNRRFFGVDVQHKFSENLAIGGTFLNLRERPFTQKAQFGSEPVNNSIAGINFTYNTEVPKLTKWVNYLPNIDTDAPSNLSIRAEAAYLIPNSPKGIELNGEAASYLDDFEGTQIPLNIDTPDQWKMASTPQLGAIGASLIGDGSNLDFGKKRARLSWYNIDRLFYGSSLRPDDVDDEELSREEVRSVGFSELFPNQELDITQTNIVRTFDLAYYPEERGSYNYDDDPINIDPNTGKFTDPENRWGGIMRALTTTDFQQANVEYIQFWLMDPYDNYSINEEEGGDSTVNPEDNTGELYFNLGNISEDILKDNRRMFENGLPEDGIQIDDDNVNFTDYSSVPTVQSLLNAFPEDNNARPNQDVGLDGLDDDAEKNLGLNTNQGSSSPRFLDYINFVNNNLTGSLRDETLADISNDNYEHFRSTNGSILSRYKNFNRTEGNSETIDNSVDFPTAATQFPDTEDLNRDQTMSTAEGYHQYKIPINRTDFVVGTNNIVDSKTTGVTLPNGQTRSTTWYQYRIPVQSGSEALDINSFNSIRFIRMFVTKFKKPIVLRFGRLELVRGNWRRYTNTLEEPSPIPLEELDITEQAKFEVGVVNIIENDVTNAQDQIAYVLPPGVERVRLQGSTSVQQQNEQSLTIKVTDLPAGETRAVFKNTSFDIRMFKKYKMFIHANQVNSNFTLEDGEIAAIIRLGSDLTENYYEIQMPLNITALTGETSAEEVWKNNLEAALEEFGKLRLERFEDPDPSVAPNILYPENGKDFGTYKLFVKGNPTLAKIKTMMLGVRNLSTESKTAKLWFNEMRVVDFDNEGGWSAVANVNANFADFADVAVSGAMATKGFGSLDQKVNERSQDDTQQYDIVANVNLGQLLPKNYGVKLPLNISVAEEFKDPKYDPQYQDVLFEDTNVTNSPNRNNATDYTKRRSFSLINVRKEKTNNKKKARIYDVENLSVSFAYNDVFHKDYNVEKFNDQNVRAGATYNYSFEPKSYEPFKKSKFLGKYKSLKILKDFNINPLPNNFAVNSNIIRSYNEQLSRPLVLDTNLPDLPTLERRRFAFDWDYSIAYDLTKSLQFNFRAANTYINDQFDKDINNRVIDGQLFDKFFSLGRPEHYTQVLDATYKIPFSKIPILDFVTATYNYTADFDWRASSLDNIELVGNTIQNANTHNINADLNMNKLYKKIGVNKLFKKSSNRRAKLLKKKAKANKKKEKALAKAIKKALRKGDSVAVAELKKKKNTTSFANAIPKSGNSTTEDASSPKGKKGSKSGNSRGNSFRKKLTLPQKIVLAAVDLATSVKKVRISYTENNSTLLPGYTPEIGFLGRDNVSGGLAPTFGFVFGSQSSILNRALSNDWLVDRDENSPFYSKTYNNTHFEDLKLNFDLKPFKNLKIDLIANKTKTRNISQQLDVITETDTNGNTTVINDPFASPINEVGNFAISNMMIGTSFKNRDALFDEFLNNREVIAQRLASDAGQSDTTGFGENNQSVLLPAFFAAYAGRDVNSVKTSAFRDIPIPNWRVSYKGLSKVKALKKIFRTITLEHNYQSSYSILGYTSNLQFGQNEFDAVGNYINKLQFQGVNLVEQFSPLIKLDVKMRNSFSFKGELRKDRSINLNFANSSITEIEGDEYIVGLGYKIKDVKWTVKPGGKKTVFKGDVNLKADFGIRDNITVIRSISNQTDQITGGQRIFTLKFTADYNLNKNLMASFFYDQNTSRFKVSTTFPRSSISSGISIRYNIGN